MSETERAEALRAVQMELFALKKEYERKREELGHKFKLIQGGLQKTCRKCRLTMDTEQFQRDIRNADGLYSYCRECKSAIDRARYVARKRNVIARRRKAA